MPSHLLTLLAAALVALAFAGAAPGGPAPAGETGDDARVVELGSSVRGRTIVARRIGDRSSPRKALIVGSMHGDEPAGLAITRALRSRRMRGADVWLVDTVNPDGLRAGRRQNARGVDLNRNFSYRWRRQGGRYASGPRPFSEPESRLVRRLVRKIRPEVSIWYHQPWGHVILPRRRRGRIERRYARLARFPARRLRGALARLPGTAISWQNHRFGGTAFVVELGATALGPRELKRHVRAAAAIAKG